MSKVKFERTKPHMNVGTIGHVDHGKTTLTTALLAVLAKQGKAVLKSYADIKVEIAGHTDDQGSEAYNQALSERRAKSAKAYLVSRSIENARMTPNGYGKTQPIDPATTDEARAKNRRVELRVKQ